MLNNSKPCFHFKINTALSPERMPNLHECLRWNETSKELQTCFWHCPPSPNPGENKFSVSSPAGQRSVGAAQIRNIISFFLSSVCSSTEQVCSMFILAAPRRPRVIPGLNSAPHPNCVTLGKSPNLSGLHFAIHKMGWYEPWPHSAITCTQILDEGGPGT